MTEDKQNRFEHFTYDSCSQLGFKILGFMLIIAFTASHTVFALSANPHAGHIKPTFSATDKVVYELSQASSLAQILDKESDAKFILIGETHVRNDHHQVQLEALKYLHENDIEVALGVEWFQQPFQHLLDAFIAGRISEKILLHEAGYYDRWRFDYRLYRPLLLYAREHGIPVIALNASKELTDALSKSGFDDLPPKLKDQLPSSYDWSDKDYEKRLAKIFKLHPNYSGTFKDFLRGQLTWDESMAERAAEYIKDNPTSRMLVLAGSGHVQFGSGIPNRIKRRTDDKVTTILIADSHTTVTPEMADYLVLSKEHNLQPIGLIGAFLKTSKQKLVISGFSNNSASEEAGVKAGSVIVGVDGADVVTLTDFKLEMLDKKPGDTIKLRYLENPEDKRQKAKSVSIKLR